MMLLLNFCFVLEHFFIKMFIMGYDCYFKWINEHILKIVLISDKANTVTRLNHINKSSLGSSITLKSIKGSWDQKVWQLL